MKLNINKEIMEDIITASITVAELGDSLRSSDDELEMLHDFVKVVELSQIDFTANVKVENGLPVITTDPVDGTNVVELSFSDTIMNKKIVLDENFNAELKIDTKKILPAQLNDVLTSVELYGQAMALIYLDKVKSAISVKLEEIRILANGFESETEVIL